MWQIVISGTLIALPYQFDGRDDCQRLIRYWQLKGQNLMTTTQVYACEWQAVQKNQEKE